MHERSIEMHNLRYNPFIGDGDSSSFSTVEKSMPYGPLITHYKHDCVNHVTKRMGTGLRELIKQYKGSGLKLNLATKCI